MALLNQSCIMHRGLKDDISRFILKDDRVYLTYWTMKEGLKKNDILAEGIDDIKACSDGRYLYLFCIKITGDIDVYTFKEGKFYISEIKTGGSDILLRDLRPYVIGERCQLLVSHSKKENRNERLLTKFTLDKSSLERGQKYPDHHTKDIMEYETFGPVDELAAVDTGEESSIISVIEKGEGSNSVILLRDDRFGYIEGLVKISMDQDIYWHDVYVNEGIIKLMYTVRNKDSFSIRLVEYDLRTNKLSDEVSVRENRPCSHPSLVRYMGKEWVCWYENGSVYSRVIGCADHLENVVKWKESSGRDLLYTHFIIDNESIKNELDMSCRKVFLIYPDNIVTGFGTVKF